MVPSGVLPSRGCRFRRLRYAPSIENGGALDFDQHIILIYARDFKEGRCRIVCAEELTMDFAERLEMRKVIVAVFYENGHLDDVLHRAASYLKHRLQVAQDLLILANKVARGDNLPRAIAGGLPCQKKQPPACSNNAVIKANGRSQPRRIEDVFLHLLTVLQIVVLFSA